jgi:hypothetical protein
MPARRDIPIKELLLDLTRQVHEKIRLHAVSMVLPPVGGADPRCCSGTLVQLNEMAGILTAGHVWTEIERAPSLALLVGGEPYYVKTEVLRAFAPPSVGTLPGVAAQVPDIAFVRLPTIARGRIEAYGKVFYSIDARRKNAEIDPLDERGFWILAGSPQALARPDTGMVASFLYDTSVQKRLTVGAWDYLLVNLHLASNRELPTTYGGVSGGGIWRAVFHVSDDETVFAVASARRDIILSGVAFYQTPLEGRQIIGHGPVSMYDALPKYAVGGVT